MDRAELSQLLGHAPVFSPANASVLPAGRVVAEREPAQFIARFGAAVAAGGPVFLADPNWGEVERAQFQALIAQAAGPGLVESLDSPGAGLVEAPVAGWRSTQCAAYNRDARTRNQPGPSSSSP